MNFLRTAERQSRKYAERLQEANFRQAELQRAQDGAVPLGKLVIFAASVYTNHHESISGTEQQDYMLGYAELVRYARTRQRQLEYGEAAAGVILHRTFTNDTIADAMRDESVTDLLFIGQGNASSLYRHRGNALTALDLAEMPHNQLKHSVEQHMFGQHGEPPIDLPLGSFVTLDPANILVETGIPFPTAEEADRRPNFSLHVHAQPRLDLRKQ
jgi:hypothetical protein